MLFSALVCYSEESDHAGLSFYLFFFHIQTVNKKMQGEWMSWVCYVVFLSTYLSLWKKTVLSKFSALHRSSKCFTLWADLDLIFCVFVLCVCFVCLFLNAWNFSQTTWTAWEFTYSFFSIFVFTLAFLTQRSC